jgi:uncharacterized membrane protein YeiB
MGERLARSSGITLTALAYCGVLALAFQTRLGAKLLSPLAGIGRMALTVYIGQHVIAAALFQGRGLGWSHRPDVLSVLVPLVFGLYLAEVVLCNVWLRYFRFGPLEWIWRSLTYWRLQPLLRENAVERPREDCVLRPSPVLCAFRVPDLRLSEVGIQGLQSACLGEESQAG